MNKKLFIEFQVFLLVLGLNSCNEIPPKHKEDLLIKISINPDEAGLDSILLSEFARRIEYIPLQTNANNLIGYIYNFNVTDSLIFIENGLELLKYSTDGKLLNMAYIVGRGPGETLPVCSAIDFEHERVFVFDRNKKIKVYGFNGDYISDINNPINPVESLPPWKIEYFENYLFVSIPQKPGVDYIYSLFDLKTDSIIPLYKNRRLYTKDQQSQWPSFIPWDYCYQVGDSSLLFKERYCDTVFIVNRNVEVRPRFVLEITKKLEWETWRDNGMFDISSGPPEGFFVNSIAESSKFVFLVLSSFKHPKIFVLYNKVTGKTDLSTIPNFNTHGSQVYLKNDLDFIVDFPIFSKSNGLIFFSEECLYSVLEASYFKEAYSNTSEERKNSSKYLRDMRPVLSSVTEFCNPVIMKVHLK